MKKKLLIYSIIVLTLLLFSASTALAILVCPPGKVKVTIASPGGVIMERCIPVQALEHIGGPGDVVIPADCTCFNYDAVMAAPITYCYLSEGYAAETGESCTFIDCRNDSGSYNFFAQEQPTGETCTYDDPLPIKCISLSGNCCIAKTPLSYIKHDPITEAEGDACAAILKTFNP